MMAGNCLKTPFSGRASRAVAIGLRRKQKPICMEAADHFETRAPNLRHWREEPSRKRRIEALLRTRVKKGAAAFD
jgi:hypothetical protein